jgi:NADH:ubiquinone oxidoreductase subunit 5 (subunit L)/multisubunit Na+/H+ antiporter MnhA subunit
MSSNKSQKLLIPVVLLVIASILLLVSGVFSTLSFISLNSVSKVSSNPTIAKNRRFALIATIVAWLGFLISLVLIWLNYMNYSNYKKTEDTEGKIKAKLTNSLFLWGTIIVVSLFSLIAGSLMLYVTIKTKEITSSAYTNALISSVTSIGGFIFILVAGIAYGFTTKQMREYLYKKFGRDSIDKPETVDKTMEEQSKNEDVTVIEQSKNKNE